MGWMAQPSDMSTWTALQVRVANLVSARAKGRCAGEAKLWACITDLIQRIQLQPRILEDPVVELDMLDRVLDLRELKEGQKATVTNLKVLVKKLEVSLLRSSHRRFKDWITNSLRTGGGAVHRFTKQFGEPRRHLADEYDDQGEVLNDPLKIVEQKATRWGTLWRASPGPKPTPDWWQELRRRADAEDRQEITLDQLGQALRCFRRRIGMGGDRVNPRWWPNCLRRASSN